MATYVFSQVKGKSISFNPKVDVLLFDFGSAADLKLSATLTTVTFNLGVDSVTLTNAGVLGALALTPTNVSFADGSQLLIGDATINVIRDFLGNSLRGSSGKDLLVGLTGNDTLDGGEGSDTYLVTGFADGTDVYRDTGKNGIDRIIAGSNDTEIELGSRFSNALTGIEEISANGYAEVSVSATSKSDLLDFSSVRLTGLEMIDAEGGNDTVIGSAGDDTIRGGSGHDLIDGGAGRDTALYSGRQSSYSITFVDGTVRVKDMEPDRNSDDGTDTLQNIEVLQFRDGKLELTVPTPNLAPVAADDALTAEEDAPLTTAASLLVANDKDPEGNPLTVTAVGNAVNGAVALANGAVTFTPDANFSGTASYEYTVSDGKLTDIGLVKVNVAAVNDAPVANDDNLLATEDAAVTYLADDLLGNDTDVDGPALQIATVSSGTGGTAKLNSDGTVSFTPDADFNGAATFTYQATDGTLLSNSAAVTVNVAAVADATVSGTVIAGPVIAGNGLIVEIFQADGATKLGEALLDENGQFTVNVGSYTGVIIARVADANAGDDYLDEATGAGKDLNATLFSASVVTIPDAPITLNVNPLTTIAYQKMGANPGAQTVQSTNAAVATGFGLDDLTTSAVITTNSGNFGADDGLSAGERYGAVLAAISGADLNNGGDTQATIDALAAGIAIVGETIALDLDAQTELVEGASKADPSGVGTLLTSVINVISSVVGQIGGNDAPIANNDTLAATEDTPVTYTAAELLGNDTDVDSNTLAIASVSSGVGGTAVLNADGTVTFTPDANYNGAANFSYIATDGSLPSNSATVTVNVASINDAPVANNDTLAANEDTPVTYTSAQLLGNDTDVDSATLAIASVTSGVGGTAVLNADGTVTFTPDANYNGAANFSYVATDGSLPSNSATVTVNVASINDAPVANNDTLAANEDTPVTYTSAQLLGNDTDVDSATLAIASVTSGAGGTAVLNANGTVTFTPDANFNGAANFSYAATDGSLPSNSVTVTVNVAPINDAPVAVDDVLVTSENTALVAAAALLTGNDTDVDGDALTVTAAGNALNGTVTLTEGQISFTPDSNFSGEASFEYTVSDGQESDTGRVTVTVGAVNNAPVANNDTLTATEDTPVTYTAAQLLGNDTDVDSATLAIASVTSGVGGTAVLNADGTVTFTPDANYNGAANFSYAATDGSLPSNSATVTVNVAPINDAPVANNDTLTATEDTPVTYTAAELLGNDTDVDSATLAIASVTSGAGGTAVLNADGTVTFTPDANYNGAANFSYIATDGSLPSNSATVTVNVAPINDAPVAVDDVLVTSENTALVAAAALLAGNDTDVDGDALTVTAVGNALNGTVTLTEGQISFTPDSNFSGEASFEYTVSDGQESDTGRVTVTVGAVNNAPVANNDTLTATEDTPVTYTAAQLLGNDTDVDSATLAIASVTSGTGGTAVLNADSTVTFTPDANYNGAAGFNYVATDGSLPSNSATVTVNVVPVNDAPVATSDTLEATEGALVTYTAAQLLDNDTDADGDQLAIIAVGNALNGTVALIEGQIIFSPDSNFSGEASFEYTVSDGKENDIRLVTINVGAVNTAPVANNDTLAANEDTPVTYTAAELLGNDTDVDGTTLAIASVTSGVGGTAVLNADGTVTFTPDANYNGAANFSYVATDGSLPSNSATVTVNVAPINDAPVANNDTLAATEDTPVTHTAAQLLGNDTDVDSATLAIASVTSGAGGTAVLNADGTVTFTPDANYNGAANFSYIATDGSLPSNSATVTVNVAPINDAPVANNDTLAATEDTPVTHTAAQLLGNDTDVDSATLAIASVTSGAGGTAVLNADGTVTFTPDANYNGAANFSYIATDGSLPSNSATVTVNVAPINDAPVANNDTLTATEDTPVTYTAAQLLGNDTDVDSATLAIASVGSGVGGSAALNPNGTVTFTPNANFNGVASFSYVATDGSLPSNSATATVIVAPANDAPVAVADSATVDEGGSVAIDVLANDTDVENNTLTAVLVSGPANGTLTSIGGGTSFLYRHDGSDTLSDSFTYRPFDGTDFGNAVTVAVTVTPVDDVPVNSPPLANPDTVTAFEDGAPVLIDVLANDTDADTGDTRKIVAVDSSLLQGTVVQVAADGLSISYNVLKAFQFLTTDEIEIDTFTYTMEDSKGARSTAEVRVSVIGVNDAPVAVEDFESTRVTEDSGPLRFDVLRNDTDPDGDPFGSDTKAVISVDTTGALGSVKIIEDGGAVEYAVGNAFQFLRAGESAIDIFTYTMTDGSGATSTAKVEVTVIGADEPPPAGSIIGTINGDNIDANFTPPTTDGSDTVFGLFGDDVINSLGGADTLYGGPDRDALDAGAGDDILTGNADRDSLTGGAGADIFVFETLLDSETLDPDRVQDFSSAEGDRIDLRLIDADVFAAGNNAFTLVAGGAFTREVPGQLIFDPTTNLLQGDVNGDAAADFAVLLLGVVSVSETDFLL